MELKIYRREELIRYLENPGREQFSLPTHRLRWLVDNPYSSDEDKLLIDMWEGNKIISGIALVPGLVRCEGGEKRICWFSSWWVDKDFVSAGAIVLLQAAEAAGDNAMIVSYSRAAAGIYEDSGLFRPVGVRHRHYLFLSPSPDVLFEKKPRFRRLFPLIALANPLIRRWSYRRLSHLTDKFPLTPGWRLEYSSFVDQQLWRFIEPLANNELAVKTREYFAWMLDPRMQPEAPLPELTGKKHVFSGYSRRNTQIAFRVFSEQGIEAFVCFLVTNRRMSLKFFYLRTPGIARQITALILRHCEAMGVEYFVTHDPVILESLKSMEVPFIFKKVDKKPIIVYRDTEIESIEGYRIQDGDGA